MIISIGTRDDALCLVNPGGTLCIMITDIDNNFQPLVRLG